ncbi:hypothetical protein [Nocardia salmonicida]|uniref:hypothetical protein n=1 Tax=Nocardia salmonicida TaxID=53431 RepID=UPI0033D7FFB6
MDPAATPSPSTTSIDHNPASPPASTPTTDITPGSDTTSPAERSPYVEAGGARRPRNAYDTEAQDAWANNVYDHIRSTDTDIDGMVAALADVPRHDGSVGFDQAELERIKNHLFREEHPLSVTDDNGNDIGIEYRRYDAYADIAEAWMRMTLGRATPDDIVLLEHELAEAQYYESHPGAPYQEAHQFANQSFNWEAMQHSHTGENIDEWSSVYGNVSGVPAGVGDRPGSDLPVRRGGSQSQSVPDDQQGGLLGEGRGREGGRDGRENSRHSDDSSPSGRSLDQGGQLPSLNNPPRQSGGHNGASNLPPNSPSSGPAPSPDSVPQQRPAAVPPATDSTGATPAQHGPETATPPAQQAAATDGSKHPSSGKRSPQALENAAQSRIAREQLRSTGTAQGESTRIGNQRSGASFQARRIPDFFGQPVRLLRVAVHFSGSTSVHPDAVSELSELAQLATDLAFNGGHQFVNGEWVMVDLVPVGTAAEADMRVRVDDSGAPGTTHPNIDLSALTNRIRDQLGLNPTTDNTLSSDDLQQLSSQIDHATFSTPTTPPWHADSVAAIAVSATNPQGAPPATSPPNNFGQTDIRAPESNSPPRHSPPRAPASTNPNTLPSQIPREHQHWGTPNPNQEQSRVPPRTPDRRVPESTSQANTTDWRQSTLPARLGSNAPQSDSDRHFDPRNFRAPESLPPPPHSAGPPATNHPAGSRNEPQSSRSVGAVRRIIRRLFGMQPRRNVTSTQPAIPPTQRQQSVAPRPPDTNSQQQSAPPQDFSDLPYSNRPPYATQEMNPTYRGEHELGNPVWEYPLHVAYFSEADRQRFRLYIIDGKIYTSDGKLFDTSSSSTAWGGAGRAIFVMDEHGNLYASDYHERGLFHHSSFLAGENVAAAGEMAAIDGELQMITDSSGHYRPSRGHTMQAIHQLRSMGIVITPGQVRFEAPPQ